MLDCFNENVIAIIYKNSIKKIAFVVVILIMMFIHLIFSYANVILEDCGSGTYCISDTLYQVELPENAPMINTKIYCTREEVNKKEPENNIIIVTGPTNYSTSMEDLNKFMEIVIKGIIHENQMFNMSIDKYDTNVSSTKNGDTLISIIFIMKNGLFEARHFIIKDYWYTIVSERCIDFNKKRELDENVQLVLDTYVFK